MIGTAEAVPFPRPASSQVPASPQIRALVIAVPRQTRALPKAVPFPKRGAGKTKPPVPSQEAGGCFTATSLPPRAMSG